MYMLKIQEYLRKHGIEKTVKDFKLNYKDLGHKFILKYSQLDSPKTKIEVCESRGLVLHKETFEIISFPFSRFFEYNDCLSPKLKSNKTIYTEKRDGSLIQIYFDKYISEWCINTMFSECKEFLYFNGQKTDLNFEKLVLNLFEEYETSFDNFNKGFTYVFELTSQYNRVVVRYQKPELNLIGVRNLETLEEFYFEDLKPISEKIRIPLVKTYSFDSLEECIQSFENMSFNFEGYVGREENKRIKIHNPVWTLVHQKGKQQATEIDLTDKSIFLDLIKQGGVEDFILEFPQTSEIVLNLQKTYFESISKLKEVYKIVDKPKNISKEESKKFAENVFKTLSDFGVNGGLSQIIFLLQQGKISSVKNYFRETPNKKLYNWLK